MCSIFFINVVLVIMETLPCGWYCSYDEENLRRAGRLRYSHLTQGLFALDNNWNLVIKQIFECFTSVPRVNCCANKVNQFSEITFKSEFSKMGCSLWCIFFLIQTRQQQQGTTCFGRELELPEGGKRAKSVEVEAFHWKYGRAVQGRSSKISIFINFKQRFSCMC